jgi:hypothetical protein
MIMRISRQELLSYLAKHTKISGSWARGEQQADSDIDLTCTFKQIDKIANYLNKLGCKWDSDLSGYITIPSSEFGVFIEISVLFPRYKNYKSVDVLGVTFKT